MKDYNKILVIGSGYMAKEYLNVIKSMNLLNKVEIFTKTKKSYETIYKLFNLKLKLFKNLKNGAIFSHAIVCVNEDKIFKVVKKLINLKLKNILIEKPGGANLKELMYLNKLALKNKININVAYNRRYYENIIYLKEIFKKEKILSAQFSFTEWIEKIELLNYSKKITSNWFHYNSLHLIDLVFFIIGLPKKIFSLSKGNNKMFGKTLFVGSGISKKNIFFTYHSNWESAGRWSIELFTNKKRFILSPLETVQIQKKNELEIKTIKLKTKFDHKFKPGIFLITKNFFENKKILSYKEYIKIFKLYNIILKGN